MDIKPQGTIETRSGRTVHGGEVSLFVFPKFMNMSLTAKGKTREVGGSGVDGGSLPSPSFVNGDFFGQ